MEKIKVNLSYWTYPEGDDFDDIETFKNDLAKEFDTDVTSQPTDALGGGLYEFAVEIIKNVDFADIAKDYLEDGIKVGLAFFWKPIFSKIKELFKKNTQFKPDIEVAKFIFRDIEIVIYPIYPDSIDEVIDEVIQTLAKQYAKIKSEVEVVKSIHIPIFDHVDYYEICAYRVKLKVDENIPQFKREDYFTLWGVRGNDDYVFEVKTQNLLKTKFYTEPEYDILLQKKFDAER